MEFVLAGFKQFDDIRQYYFDAVGEDRSRQQVTIGADLSLIRKYGIPLQELPLLCRLLLERRAKIETTMFTESDMVQYVNERAARANASMEKRRAHRGPVSSRVGHAWRGSSPPEGER
jgi:hypothetical protein